MRDETRRAAESLAAALVVGLLHLAWLSGRFATPQGAGGVTLLLGCVVTTGVLWAMLAMRALAAGGAPGPALDDGLTAMAATGWLVALWPPRAENFLLEGPVDEFAQAYLPVSLVAVFFMLAAQRLWVARTVGLVLVRLTATTLAGGVVLGVLLWRAR